VPKTLTLHIPHYQCKITWTTFTNRPKMMASMYRDRSRPESSFGHQSTFDVEAEIEAYKTVDQSAAHDATGDRIWLACHDWTDLLLPCG
jgi:hypothetical protein